MSEIQVTCIGTKASELLGRQNFSAQVLAVVSNAAYLSVYPHPWLWQSPPQSPLPGKGEGEVIWLAQNDVKHQRAVRCSFDASALHVGMRFDKGMLSDWANASVWQPSTIAREHVAARRIVATRVRELIDSFDSPRGFAQIIPLIRSHAAIAPTFDPFIDAAKNPVIEVARAWRSRDMSHALQTSRALIGLGQGLTPSGDDFIGGMLFATYHLKIAFPGIIEWKQKSIDDLLAWARDKTNAISYTILRDHASGQSVDALHDLMNALLIGKGSEELITLAQRLINVGNTSGWDMLAGGMTCLLAIE
ncbi:MAG: DUF2877 domain-containing protein [Chloroflexi bacterium]|nr:DUF2877 domain-containing protein [Chloroflexota bacterium]